MLELEILRKEVHKKFGKNLSVDIDLDDLHRIHIQSKGVYTKRDIFEMLEELTESAEYN
jgi:hypothetical protein